MIVRKYKVINSFLISAIIVVVFIASITIAAELFPNLKSLLKDTFIHHWVGKGVLAVLLFLILAFLYNLFKCEHEREKTAILLLTLAVVTVLCFFIILGFYLYLTFLAGH